MKYNIIGDTHGRTAWKKLVKDNCINIFVGDYFSPYDDISFEDCVENLSQILDYKDKHPETILLLGNHDNEYLIKERYSRHDYENEDYIKEFILENIDYFQVAYSIENKVLITHAGVTFDWFIANFKPDGLEQRSFHFEDKSDLEEIIKLPNYVDEKDSDRWYKMMYFCFQNQSNIDIYDKDKLVTTINTEPDNVAKLINENFKENKYNYSFSRWGNFDDYYGTTPSQSPLWIRPQTLSLCNLYKHSKYPQVFGHTQCKNILGFDNLWNVDCLGYSTESLIYDSEKEEFKINKIEE